MNKFLLLVSAFIFQLSVAQAELFKADEFVLDNGLHCVVIQNHKAPIIKHMLWYKVGAVQETSEKGGSAHLLEHLMFRGTKQFENGKFNSIMNYNGVESNAFTSYDVTAYHQFADISRLEVLMALEADRMQNLAFDEKSFEAEKKIVFQERKQMVESNPASPFFERLNLMLWGNSPYGHPITGLNREIKNLKYADIRQFYEMYYAPNNAILVLSGDIDLNTAKSLAQKYYGKLKPKKFSKQVIEPEVEKFSQTLTMNLPNIASPKIVYKYLLPEYRKLKGNIYDYMVLAEYLGGGQTSALYRNLVITQHIAVGVQTGYDFFAGGNSTFYLSLTPAEEVDTLVAKEELKNALSKAMVEFNVNELKKVKNKMLADLVFVNDNPEDAAYLVGYMLANGFKLKEVQDYERGIANVTQDGVLTAYREIFANSAKVEGTLLPEDK